MNVWVVTFNDDDGNGGTHSYPVAVFATQELACQYVGSKDTPSWYDVDEFPLQGVYLRKIDDALLGAISALAWLPPDNEPERKRASEAVDVLREARMRLSIISGGQ